MIACHMCWSNSVQTCWSCVTVLVSRNRVCVQIEGVLQAVSEQCVAAVCAVRGGTGGVGRAVGVPVEEASESGYSGHRRGT